MARRRSYADRTGANTKAAKIAAQALSEQPVYIETIDGYRVRQWRPEELQRFKNEDIALALRYRRALEEEEMLEHIPPSAIKYAVTKGWLARRAGLYMVTLKAAEDLKLPAKANGQRIRFLEAA